MKNKAKFLMKQSIKKKMDTKWFKVVNIILLLLIVAVINLDSIINFFGGDFDESTKIYVVDEVGTYEAFDTYFNEMGKSVESFSNFELINSKDNLEDLKEDLDDTNDNIIVNIVPDNENVLKANIISYDPVDTITQQIITSSLTAIKTTFSLASSGLTEEELNKIVTPIEINEELTNPELDENAEAKDILSAGSIIIFIVPFFILVVLIVQMIGAEINDEKTTRGMEIIISNVSPKAHFISKILATTFFAISQCILIFIYGAIGLLVRKLVNGTMSLGTDGFGSSLTSVYETLKNSGMLDSLIKAAPILIIIFLLSFLVYALLAGILASMTTSIEDYQQLQTPLMIIIMIGYYIALMASVFNGSIFIKIMSYLPFLSALIAPVVFLLGQTTIIDLLISTGALLITCYLLIHYGIRIYKVGILNYSSKDLWKKVFKSLRNKE